MKSMNFPGRRFERRIKALSRLVARPSTLNRNVVSREIEIGVLQSRTESGSSRNQRSKKRRVKRS